MNSQAVIFDLFGTIVDGFSVSSAGYQEQFAAALGVPRDELSQHWGQLTDRRTLGEFQTVEESIAHVCSLIGAKVTAAQMMRAVEIRLQLTRHALRPQPDALSTIAQLKSAGYRIGLLSNCSVEIPLIWPETAFAPLFDATVFSSCERIKKPAAEIYHLACQRLNVAPENCVYVADGENFELTAAAQIGVRPILIKTGESHSEVRREAREWQGITISTLPEVLQWVEVERSKHF